MSQPTKKSRKLIEALRPSKTIPAAKKIMKKLLAPEALDKMNPSACFACK
jgi:hypothetical protein